jgi:hypothetical protein
MHRMLTIMLGFSLAVPCPAADEPKLNTLTSKEIAEGVLLLFDGETTFGWSSDGQMKVQDGALVLGDKKKSHSWLTTSFPAFEIDFQFRKESDVHAAFNKRRYPLSDPGVGLLRTTEAGWYRQIIKVEADFQNATARTDYLILGPTGKQLHVSTGLGEGIDRRGMQIGFRIEAGGKLVLRNIKLKPLRVKPLFNGKDLTGWKEFPGKKSTFTVTNDCCLSIKNGPGDLQTTGEWANFVLQLEGRTNGDNLNSGVFFRCIPGQYQNGYEAQIQNQKAKEPKKYTIEEYDPKTHELKGKKTLENWSQDYGTGAIYRRIPARRSAAGDREWFTMTVVAHGRHIATWVDGIQVVDWDDNRPENENPRNGCRLKRGPISLQGHDPTTDLNFRNIRIADFGEKN